MRCENCYDELSVHEQFEYTDMCQVCYHEQKCIEYSNQVTRSHWNRRFTRLRRMWHTAMHRGNERLTRKYHMKYLHHIGTVDDIRKEEV
jgi:hypothetical protein